MPIARGQMRNQWFPQRIAAYVTVPEMRTLRLSNTTMERDFSFVEDAGTSGNDPMSPWQDNMPSDIRNMSTSELQNASAFQRAAQVDKITPARSMELVEIFVPKRLDFYRQPIMEEKEVEEAVPAEPKRQRFTAGGAAGDLLAARQRVPSAEKAKVKEVDKKQAIYGSVSTHDVLVAMRAAMGTNDEAARVALQESEIQFVDLPVAEEAAKVLKHIGDFSVEIKVKGAEEGVRRTVRVIAQEI